MAFNTGRHSDKSPKKSKLKNSLTVCVKAHQSMKNLLFKFTYLKDKTERQCQRAPWTWPNRRRRGLIQKEESQPLRAEKS